MEAFLVRVWEPGEPVAGGLPRLCGTAVHLGSGRAISFADECELMGFVTGVCRVGHIEPDASGTDIEDDRLP